MPSFDINTPNCVEVCCPFKLLNHVINFHENWHELHASGENTITVFCG
jgi:hypothetical protein